MIDEDKSYDRICKDDEYLCEILRIDKELGDTLGMEEMGALHALLHVSKYVKEKGVDLASMSPRQVTEYYIESL